MILCDGYESALCAARAYLEQVEQAIVEVHAQERQKWWHHSNERALRAKAEREVAYLQECESQHDVMYSAMTRERDEAKRQVAYERERNMNNILAWEEEIKKIAKECDQARLRVAQLEREVAEGVARAGGG